jgi:mono/diheme cytochrome c family protein
MRFPKKLIRRVLISLAVLFVLVQLVPYGRDHTNPDPRHEPAWDHPRTRELARRACFDCHSNETKWPWYSHVAPFSWLVQRDVEEGREELNFSEFHRRQKEADDAAEALADGEMPPWQYGLAHPDARLDEAERADLIRGFKATFGKD